MREFARCCIALGETASVSQRIAVLADHLRSRDPESAALAAWLLLGHRPRRSATSAELRAWASEAAGIPEWLFAASRDRVGDTAETISLLLPERSARPSPPPLVEFHRRFVAELASLAGPARRERIEEAWSLLDADERFVYHKLIGGGFRIGVSAGLVHRAVAEALAIPLARVSDRLRGHWRPDAEAWRALAEDRGGPPRGGEPLPFRLAKDLDAEGEAIEARLGPIAEWQAEWKYDGLRGQLVHRGGHAALWSRGEERLDRAFPELLDLAASLPDGTVLDGEITIWEGAELLPFNEVQRRLGRTRVEPSLFDRRAARFIAYDLLEEQGQDLRESPLSLRRERLASLASAAGDERLLLSEILAPASWAAAESLRTNSREIGVEGLMLKRRDSPYGRGRSGEGWLKWKADPLAADLVVVAAQPGAGRRAGLLTDYTLAVWGDAAGGPATAAAPRELVTVAKAYSGLSDAEIAELDRTLRRSTLSRRGPVRIVDPTVVLEIGFEGVNESPRHRAGIALRFPRILRWRRDKPAAEASSLADLRRHLGRPQG
jgi:DNA ligase-1